MSLYLCVLRSDAHDDEIDGVDVGSYADLHELRTTIAQRLEQGQWGSRYPILMGHSDSEGMWSISEARGLASELEAIRGRFAELPAIGVVGEWQAGLAKTMNLNPTTLAECFIDVDGEPLLERLIMLAHTATSSRQPIWFQ